MKAGFIREHGSLEKLEVGKLNHPEIGPNDVLVKVKYAALNHIDIFVVKGWPGLNLKLPHVLGSDGCGIVEDIGSAVTKVKKGDKVTINPGISCGKCYQCLSGRQNFCPEFSILGENQWGSFAEFVKVPELNLLKIPNENLFKEAAAAPLTFLTAWRMLTTQGNTQRGDYVFIHGSGGGVSSAAIQIAKYLGATVISTTSTEDKMQKAEEIGADFVFNYEENENYSSEVYKDITNKEGIDVVIDSVGKATFNTSIRLLKPGGRIVTCGVTSGPKTEIDIRHIFWKQLEIKGSTMSNQKEFRDIMKLVFERKITPVIDRIFPLDEIRKAEVYLDEGKQFGKVLIEI
jgi:NADPH:quinone reductase-like Zn-dependent oxidoreductase